MYCGKGKNVSNYIVHIHVMHTCACIIKYSYIVCTCILLYMYIRLLCCVYNNYYYNTLHVYNYYGYYVVCIMCTTISLTGCRPVAPACSIC